MKNNVLEKIEEINEEKKLSEDSKKEILRKIFENLIIAVNVMGLFTILIVSALFLNKQNLINIYNMSSVLMLAFTIFVFELAYKKDSGSLAICGIEMLVFSIAILFMPYSLLKLDALLLKLVNIYIAVYYTIKVIIMYNKYKSKTLLENSDIKQIVKKESKDSKVEEAIEEIKKNKAEWVNKKEKEEPKETTKRKTTKKASTTKKETNKEKTTTKKATKSKTETTKTENGEAKKTTRSKKATAEKENTEKKKTTKSKEASAKKESNGTKKTTKKSTSTDKKVKPKEENVTTPKKRGRPRKEQSNQ